jgi:hypothetical protein
MNVRAMLVAALLVSVAPAWAADDSKALIEVRLTTERALLGGCSRIGSVSDNSIKDLRRKILKVGGNAGVLSFGIQDLSMMQAEVFRCPESAGAPPRIPPPPAGAPPAPPPARSEAPPPPPAR